MGLNLFAKITELQSSNLAFALCTVVAVQGSTPRKPGAKMIVIDNHEPFGEIFSSIGGGAIEHQIRAQAIWCIRKSSSQLVTTSLRNELGMCCGGEMTVFIEPIVKKPIFICFGAGHIAQALCPLMTSLDFDVFVVDEREELLNLSSFSSVTQRLNQTSVFSLEDMPFFAHTFVVVATHDHDLDQRLIEAIIGKPYQYLALVGSQRKALMTKKRLLAKGFQEALIEHVHCPAGLSIQANTPEEIALSIAAQIIQLKNMARNED